MPRIRIVVADDHTLVREGIRALLAREADIEIVAEVADGAQVQKTVERLKPDILILDHLLVKGPQSVMAIRARCPETEVLALTEEPPGENFLEYIRAGAKGAIWKGDTGGDLAKAIRSVAAGEVWAKRKVMAKVLEELSLLAHRLERPQGSPVASLTQREMKVGELVAKGFNNREIAEALHLSEKTVKNHLTTIFQKLRCRNRSQLTALLLR